MIEQDSTVLPVTELQTDSDPGISQQEVRSILESVAKTISSTLQDSNCVIIPIISETYLPNGKVVKRATFEISYKGKISDE